MDPIEEQIYVIIFATIFLAGLMSTFVISMIFIHRQRQNQNRQKIEHMQAEYERTMLNIENEIQNETLSHIGRELHDNIGQLLSLAKLNFNSSKPEKKTEGQTILNQVIQEVRGLSKTLNLDWVEETSLEDFIQQQLSKIESTGFCNTKLDYHGEQLQLNKDHKLVLIRVIQEVLNNAIKHASPKNIEISLESNGKGKNIYIKDDGKGFDVSKASNGSGMSNLKKRMQTIGGEFYITSKKQKGTEIKLSLPK
ncbi:sensor histidine kinase [Algoriphagus namhaensis]|uniref:histidine kinase n=1 Tax=Algoriphagus namhaensis TaxID=915353 RepID=A0ABV8API6_9BACT